MNVVGLHPEDLIDKLECGSLGADERARLEAHLRGCAECRFEISVRADLADEAIGPRARPVAPLAPPSQAPRPLGSRRSLPPRRALFVPALAAALVAGGALAAVVSEVVRARPDQASLHRLEAPSREGSRVQASGGRRRGAGSRTGPVTGAAPGAEGTEPAGVESSPAALVEPEAGGHGAPEATTAEVETPADAESTAALAELRAAGNRPPSTDANRAGAFTVTRVRGVASPAAHRADRTPEATTGELEPRTAAALFGAANRARRYGDTAQAVTLYHALQASFPASEEARLSRATLATLELDRGDPGAALEDFDRYIEQGGSALSVEALVGRAAALSKLGKTSEELASWKEVARRFPGTVHAKRAAARIAVLSGR